VAKQYFVGSRRLGVGKFLSAAVWLQFATLVTVFGAFGEVPDVYIIRSHLLAFRRRQYGRLPLATAGLFSLRHGWSVPCSAAVVLQGGNTSALDRPSGLRALAEMLLVPAGGDVRLGAAVALDTAKVTSLSDER